MQIYLFALILDPLRLIVSNNILLQPSEDIIDDLRGWSETIVTDDEITGMGCLRTHSRAYLIYILLTHDAVIIASDGSFNPNLFGCIDDDDLIAECIEP